MSRQEDRGPSEIALTRPGNRPAVRYCEEVAGSPNGWWFEPWGCAWESAVVAVSQASGDGEKVVIATAFVMSPGASLGSDSPAPRPAILCEHEGWTLRAEFAGY